MKPILYQFIKIDNEHLYKKEKSSKKKNELKSNIESKSIHSLHKSTSNYLAS